MVDSTASRDGRAGGLFAALFLRETSFAALLLLAGIPVLAGGWAVFSSPVVLSTEMTWDLLFNLSGAWHLRWGHVPNIDFHEPVGMLNFMLTNVGFDVVGPSPRALLIGVAIVAAAVFVLACFAAGRRLPLVPAALFVVFVCLLILRPANVGDHPNAYSFAMTYNRYGWSIVAVIALVLFLPPRRGWWSDTADMVLVAALLVALFYLKVTYFAAAMAALAVALAACPHVSSRWPGWLVVGLIGLAAMLCPFNWPYLADLAAAARAGIVREDAAFFLNDFADNIGEYAPYVAALGIAMWLWWSGKAPPRVPVATGFLLFAGLALLSQNSQAHGSPLAVVIAFLLYQTLRDMPARAEAGGGGTAALLAALLIFALAPIASASVSLAGYHARTVAGGLKVVRTTNLAGLAVPAEPAGLLAAFAGGGGDVYRLLNRARAVRPRYELSPYEYVETLLQAVTLLRDNGLGSGRIAVLDQVDPLPFMLGLEPPRGGNLWSGAGAPTPTAAAYLADADHVLIPKFSTSIAWTEQARAAYGPYLDEHFPHRVEGRSWIVLSRK